MAGFLLLDMPVRWLMDLFDAVSGNRGYLAVGSVLAAYLAAFGLIDTKSTQEETRAAVERSLFITLVPVGMWAKARPVGEADRPHIHGHSAS